MLSKTAIKYIQSLSFKKFRDEKDVFVAEGPKVVEEILRSGKCKCRGIYATAAYLDEAEDKLSSNGINMEIVSQMELEKMSGLKKPNLILAVFEKREIESLKNLENNITLILDNIMDPGNMGTIIRIADWFGLKNIICSEHCVDIYNPKVIQSSMASIARINIVYKELVGFIREHSDIKSYAATLRGKSIFTSEKMFPCFLIIGNESKGIEKKILDIVNEEISIPRIGDAESLNAAVATGILISAIKN